MEINTKTFMEFNVADIAERCRNQNDAIVLELCKLTYLNSEYDRDHWTNILAGIIASNAKNNLKGKCKFDYSWFFELRGFMDVYDAEVIFESLPEKYNNIKEINPDFNKLANNVNNFRSRLTEEFFKLGRTLTKDEVKNLILELDLYKFN